MNPRTLALLSILIAAVVGGGSPVFSKISLQEIPPFSFIFIRFFLSSILMLPFFIKQNALVNKNTLKVILISLFSTANIILFTFGIRLTTATSNQMIYAFVPIMTAIISYFLIKERFSLRKINGIILGFLGTLLIVLLPAIGQPSAMKGNLAGNLLILTGAIFFSFYPVFPKKLQSQYSPLYLTLGFSFTTALVSLLFVPLELIRQPGWFQTVPLTAWLAMVYVAVLGTIAYYLLVQYAIKHGTPVIGSIILYLQPAAVFIWAAALLGERLTPGLVIGGMLALSGAYLVTQAKAPRG